MAAWQVTSNAKKAPHGKLDLGPGSTQHLLWGTVATSNKSLEHIPNFKPWVVPTDLPIGLFTVVRFYSCTEVFCWITARETSTSAWNLTVKSSLEFNYVLRVFKHRTASGPFRWAVCQRAKQVLTARNGRDKLHAVRCVYKTRPSWFSCLQLGLGPVAAAEQARCWHKMLKVMKKTFSFAIPGKHICSHSHNRSHANPYEVAP